jgi:GMP synthase (glutamine-hydrolysing)
VNVLAVIHGERVRAGVFGDVAEARGHVLEEWSLAWNRPLARPLDDYGAVLVFGGAMHADQEGNHPWLREENLFLQRLLDRHVPVLGVCLGAQLLAKAAHADVAPAREPEIGWFEVELTEEAEDDPLFAELPARFQAFQWHYYEHALPAGAVELARSAICSQAFRLGDVAWGVQSHPEVTLEQVRGWIAEEEHELPVDARELERETEQRIAGWQTLGRSLCGTFLEVAERVAVPA